MDPEPKKRMLLDFLEEKLRPDGTHPDFPQQKFFREQDWAKIPWSDLVFDLPALVVYEQKEPNARPAKPALGLVIALSHQVGKTELLVLSKHDGKIICHPAEKAPSGLKPSYLLLRKHVPMTGLP